MAPAMPAMSAMKARSGSTTVSATMRAQGWPIVLTVFTFVLGLLATLLIAIRLIAQPGLGVDASPSIGFRIAWEGDA